MEKSIVGAQPFQVPAHSFGVSPSNESYTVYLSVDGVNYSKAEENAVTAGDTLVVSNSPRNMFYMLSGNNSTVKITW